jgi:hypothetical protein
VAGYREFQTGEVLTAANVNNFLMEQAVLTFPDAAARAAALADVLREGILTYNEDTAQLEVYDGSAFVVAAPAPPAGIGSNVVQAVKTDTFTTTSTSFTTVTGLSLSFTPTSATSKVLLIAQVSASLQNTQGVGHFRFSGGNSGTYIGDAGLSDQVRTAVGTFWGTGNNNGQLPFVFVYLDSPATGSAITYAVEARQAFNGTVTVNNTVLNANDAGSGRTASSLTAIEVAV